MSKAILTGYMHLSLVPKSHTVCVPFMTSLKSVIGMYPSEMVLPPGESGFSQFAVKFLILPEPRPLAQVEEHRQE